MALEVVFSTDSILEALAKVCRNQTVREVLPRVKTLAMELKDHSSALTRVWIILN